MLQKYFTYSIYFSRIAADKPPKVQHGIETPLYAAWNDYLRPKSADGLLPEVRLSSGMELLIFIELKA